MNNNTKNSKANNTSQFKKIISVSSCFKIKPSILYIKDNTLFIYVSNGKNNYFVSKTIINMK